MADTPGAENEGRRSFLKAGSGNSSMLAPSAMKPDTPKNNAWAAVKPVTPSSMPTRIWADGYKVGIFSLGGQASLSSKTTSMWQCRLSSGLDMGVLTIDTSSIYGGPERGVSSTWAR